MGPRRKRNYGTGGITWLTPGKALLRAYVTTPDGQRRQRSRTVRVAHRERGGRGEAQEALDAFLAEIEREQERASRDTHTVDALLAAFIEDRERVNRRQGTIESYRLIRKRLAVGGFADEVVEDLGPERIDHFYGDLSETYSSNTIRQTHAVLSAALGRAVDWRWIPANPAKAAVPPPRERAERKPLDLADVHRLVELAGDGGDHVLAMALVLASLTGARRGELAGLRWDDVDPEARTVTIGRQWIPSNDGGQYLGKTKSFDRPVHLGVVGMALVERYRQLMEQTVGRPPEGWLLSHDAGDTPLVARNLGRAITDLGKRAGIPVTTHSFRRVQATQLVAAGIDVDTAARRMGHTTTVMLEDYVLGASDRSQAAADVIEARLIEQGLPLDDLLPLAGPA